MAIHLTLDHLSTISVPTHVTDFIILSDCRSAVEVVSSPLVAKEHHGLISNIHDKLEHLESDGFNVKISWVPGHAGILGNEQADQCAKRGAIEAQSLEEEPKDNPVTLKAAKRIINQGVHDSWQRQWTRCSKAAEMHSFYPTIPNTKYRSNCSRHIEKKLLRLKSGFPLLNTQLHKYKFADSPLCPCGRSDETIEHFLMNCPHYMEARDSMIANIENGFKKTNTQPHLRCINTNVLLGANPYLSTAMCSVINEAVAGFLHHAPRQF